MTASPIVSSAPNPKTSYFKNGQPVGERGFTLGDPSKWGTPVKGLTGQSAGGKIKMTPDTRKSQGDTVRAVWSAAEGRGELALYGPSIDLSEFKESGALTFDLKVNKAPNQHVSVAMDCGFPCRAEFELGQILQEIPSNSWITFPIPLHCFKGKEFDLSKISGVFLMGTAGALDISIGDIRLAKLPKGGSPCPQAQGSGEAKLNPDFFYFVGGKIIGSRGFTLGDPGKWGLNMKGVEGESATGKLKVKPDDFQTENDALNLKWSKKNVKGELGLFGPATDLSPYKDLAALTFDVKVNSKPRESVKVGMDCGYPCRAEYEVGMILRKMKKKTWTSLPIPLNCFKENNFDHTKISGVFLINTEGKLDLSIANIRLEKLPEGAKTCKD